uniref:MyTH4 domain-containing protein n=1 Tax=Zonotrichia albicollis TaxID=44394 RepID=A0A8D2MD03_ZONAL
MRCTARSSSRSPTTPAPSRESLHPRGTAEAGTGTPVPWPGQLLQPGGHLGTSSLCHRGHPRPAWGISPGCAHRDSCQRGWRLLYILAAYHKCSEVLRPFLLAFLQDASRHPELPFHGIAKACEQNLRKTLQFGGRSLFPSSMELKAMVVRPGARGVEQGLRSPPEILGTHMGSGPPCGLGISLRHHPGMELILFGDLPKTTQPFLGSALHHFGGTLSLQGSPVGMELCGRGVGGMMVQVDRMGKRQDDLNGMVP